MDKNIHKKQRFARIIRIILIYRQLNKTNRFLLNIILVIGNNYLPYYIAYQVVIFIHIWSMYL